jgi:hypothetical protein
MTPQDGVRSVAKSVSSLFFLIEKSCKLLLLVLTSSNCQESQSPVWAFVLHLQWNEFPQNPT